MEPVSRDTCSRQTEVFRGSMEIDNRRSMGNFNHQGRFKTEFSRNSSFLCVKENSCKCPKSIYFTTGGRKIIRKRCHRTCPFSKQSKRFLLHIFLVPKKSGELRPVINLRPLNRYLRKQHFKMDSLSRVINLVQKVDWAIYLDLKDAYMHIPIFPSPKRFLRFCIKEKCYQFTCLCFGPKIAPRVFITKTHLYNFDPIKPHFYIVKLEFTGVYIIFLIL